jgi:Subtilase family
MARHPVSWALVLHALALLFCFPNDGLVAEWIAPPGTAKLFVRKKVASVNAPAPISQSALHELSADVIEDQDFYAILQLPLPNASGAPMILRDIADVVETLNDLDVLQFPDFPIDAREPQPAYPPEWRRDVPLPSPARDAFVVQFATFPHAEWLDNIRSAGATILEYVPRNGYVVLAAETVLRQAVLGMPVQLLRLHQPIHRVSAAARGVSGDFVDVAISVANVPEAAEAVDLINQMTLAVIRPPEAAGDHTYFRVTLDSSALPSIAGLPAVVWIDLYRQPVLSGQREVNLTLGESLVSNPGDVLQPIPADHRQWIVSKGLGTGTNGYKNRVKIAILDTGFDTNYALVAGSLVHPDFKTSAGGNFVTVRDYTLAQGADSDCTGHGTFVAGLLGGNAGVAPATTEKDLGDVNYGDGRYYMGLGVLPEVPMISGRVFNNLSSSGEAPFFNPQSWATIYTSLVNEGVGITSNSFNFDQTTGYDTDTQMLDMVVRSVNEQNGGPSMPIYFSAGNNEYPALQTRVTAPATGKNVITVGGSENYNRSPYTEPAQLDPTATGGAFANNGNEIWAQSAMGPTVLDGRIKPDVVAPASAIESPRTRDTSACRALPVGVVINDASTPIGQQHYWSRGTSFAAPLAAGVGGLLYTWYKNGHGGTPPKPALLKAMQINLARDLKYAGRPPDPKQGWGKTDLERAFATDGRYIWNNEEPNTLLTTDPASRMVTLPGGASSTPFLGRRGLRTPRRRDNREAALEGRAVAGVGSGRAPSLSGSSCLPSAREPRERSPTSRLLIGVELPNPPLGLGQRDQRNAGRCAKNHEGDPGF